MTSSYPQNFGSGSTPKKSFGAGGCQALSDGRKCGETKNLQIIHEFKRLYENKMKQIDDAAGGDCVQAKISLQQEWIRDLTDQNEMLVKVVEELEVEAAERVTMLEDKLQHTAKCACESEKLAKDKDKKVKELEEQLKKLKEVAEKNEEAQKSCQKYAELKKSMLDMRDALTAEVAEKHDTITSLRRDVVVLEEQCKKADQQTHFKDDIIKELRKELKQLKSQKSKKPRSPRTLKRLDQRLLHSYQTDPDTNIHNLKDGTITIRDIETVGDVVATQTIKEKYSDPSNQTIVYICESVPQRQKSRSRENSRIESSTSPIQPQMGDSRLCEVSLDETQASRCLHLTGSPETSRDLALDFPRDESEDVSRDSGNHLMTRNYWACPSIHETCIRYSKDILNMLNNHSVEEQKSLGQYFKSLHEDNGKPLHVNDDKSFAEKEIDHLTDIKQEFLREYKSMIDENVASGKDDKDIKQINETTDEVKEANSFVSDTFDRCEKYFLEMFQKRCKLVMDKTKSLDEGDNCKRTMDYCKNLEKYETPKTSSVAKNISSGEYLSGINTPSLVCCVSNSVQTVPRYQHNKDTQTNEGDILQAITSPTLLSKGDDLENEAKCSSADFKDAEDQFSKTAEVSTEEIWNNANVKCDDVSFDESEFRGYSSPYQEELSSWPQNEDVKFERFYPEERLMRPNLVRHQQAHRFCEFPQKVPLVPVKRYLAPPKLRQSKMLSSRTLKKVPVHPREVPLSLRSQSLPTCAEVYSSRHDLHRPVRLHKVKKPSIGEGGFVDVTFVMEDGNFCGKMRPEELHDFVELSGRQAVNARRLMREDCFDHWPNINNTY